MSLVDMDYIMLNFEKTSRNLVRRVCRTQILCYCCRNQQGKPGRQGFQWNCCKSQMNKADISAVQLEADRNPENREDKLRETHTCPRQDSKNTAESRYHSKSLEHRQRRWKC